MLSCFLRYRREVQESWRRERVAGEKREVKRYLSGGQRGEFSDTPPQLTLTIPLSKKSGPGKSGSERKAKWPGLQGHKPRTSELFLGRRSGAERGQAEPHDLKWKDKVGLVGLSALQV